MINDKYIMKDNIYNYVITEGNIWSVLCYCWSPYFLTMVNLGFKFLNPYIIYIDINYNKYDI